jgi:hypothetical protein
VWFLMTMMTVTTLLAACAPGFLSVVPAVSEPEPTAAAVSTLPANTASISGVVWHDLCALAGGESGSPVQPSAGCLPAQDGGFQANETREPDEPGLGGLLVSLRHDSCEGTGDSIDVVTNADGSYTFTNLAAGTYCVVVDSLLAENASLLPGRWTAPQDVANTGAARINVTVLGGEQRTDVNFGWDYQLLPLSPAAENVQPLARGRVNVQGLNLRAGPGASHVILRQLDEGAELELEGRSENLQWLLVRLPDGAQGWVYFEYVDTQAAIAGLPLKEASGGPDSPPSGGEQDIRQPLNVQVRIEDDLAVVSLSGFPGDSRVIVRLGEAGSTAGLQVGEGLTTENGNAVIRFTMPSAWPDGRPLTGEQFVLLASSADESVRVEVRVQYFHD